MNEINDLIENRVEIYENFNSGELKYFNSLNDTQKSLYLLQRYFMSGDMKPNKSVMTPKPDFESAEIHATQILDFFLDNCDIPTDLMELITKLKSNYYANYVSVVTKVIGSVIKLNVYFVGKEKIIFIDRPTLENICKNFSFNYFEIIKAIMLKSNNREKRLEVNEYICRIMQNIHGVGSEMTSQEYWTNLNLLEKRKDTNKTTKPISKNKKLVDAEVKEVVESKFDFIEPQVSDDGGYIAPLTTNWVSTLLLM